MELQQIYSRVLDIDKFTIGLTKDNIVENMKISKPSKYMLSNLKISTKIEEEIQKWKDQDR